MARLDHARARTKSPHKPGSAWKLRKVCEDHGIKIPFKSEADKIGAGVLWDGIIMRQRERKEQRRNGSQVTDFVPADLESNVEIMRSTVLNKLSHTESSSLVAEEVRAAIATVENVHVHKFPKISDIRPSEN